uniref:NADH-ubiquinone oxidoreductase chain 6 n=1 Tax=Pedetontus silvestrii TaxID=518099 RepID=B7SSL3_9INSE|nr:NADH dehydrogenase subunit 6 [Pedetontus silvestrii]ACC60225.1 NADH dehydrogenase subunit 6 [Pedetontus silvestrii]
MVSNLLISGLIFLMNINLMLANNPIVMGLLLMIQTILIAIYTGSLYSSFWFSYVLSLIFLGGLLVLFIYIASLASNEKFLISLYSTMYMFFLITLFLMMFLIIDNLIIPTKVINNEMILSLEMNTSIFTSISKYYINNITPTTMILIMYLFLTLIVTVKITNISLGPLRKMI